jgi:hypothetical protein
VGAPVVAGVDAPPVFQAGEQVFDAASLAVELAIERRSFFAVGLGADAGGDAAVVEKLAKPA